MCIRDSLYAIDRQSIVDALQNGHGSVTNAPMKPSSPVYPDGLNDYAYSCLLYTSRCV